MPATRQASISPTSILPGPRLGWLDAAELRARRLDAEHDAERAFVHLYGASENAFWLDSAMGGPYGRFSFIGDASGPLAAVVTYEVGTRQVRVERDDEAELLDESIFDYLRRESRRLGHLCTELPFEFDCGFAGYLGYELKADCDGDAAHEASTPDAAFVFADRLIAFDHAERQTWLLCLSQPDGAADAERWLEETSLRLASLPPVPELPPPNDEPAEFHVRRPRERYLADIAACERRLRAGETYEVCLTNKVVAEAAVEPLELYRALRRANPAPFGAFLRFGEVAVLSSSPERFLRIGRDRGIEARPIKGTSRRGETAAEDASLAAALAAGEKSRAENVTIVDLMRNDLGIVCEAGSVHVPELMRVETYETVHQLVSTVRGRLRGDVSAPDCVRACFPPGSMTGAPKKRTMEILDELEGEARGPYSGAIGYLGLGGGCDLSVAIRTIVLDGESIEIGAGGAIVLDSDPEEEYEEMLLKARAPARAIAPGAGPGAVLEAAATAAR
jgi:para-aminobenzoate synthetase